MDIVIDNIVITINLQYFVLCRQTGDCSFLCSTFYLLKHNIHKNEPKMFAFFDLTLTSIHYYFYYFFKLGAHFYFIFFRISMI